MTAYCDTIGYYTSRCQVSRWLDSLPRADAITISAVILGVFAVLCIVALLAKAREK